MKQLHVILISALCLAAFVSACGSGTHETDGQLTGVVTFATGSTSLNGKAVASGAKVRAGDKIETRENSSAVIQFDDGSLVILREQTSVDIQTIPARSIQKRKDNRIGLVQRKGTTFNKTTAQGMSYSAKGRAKVTSSGDAAYSFTVNSQSNETVVRLLRGKVNMLPDSDKSANSMKLDNREKLTSSANKKINRKAGLSKTETRELAALDTISIIPAAKLREGTYSPQDVVPDEALPLLLDKDQVRASSNSEGKPVNARATGTKHAETNVKSSTRVTDRTTDSNKADNKSTRTDKREAAKAGKPAQSNSSTSTSADGKNAASRSSAKGETRKSASADGKQNAVTRDTKSAQADTSVKSPSARKDASVSNDTKSASRPAKESGTTKSRGTQPADRKVTDANSGVKSTARVTDRTADSQKTDNKSTRTDNREAANNGKLAQNNSPASTSADGKNAASRSSAKGETRDSAMTDGKQKTVTRDTNSAQSDTSAKSPSTRKDSSVSNDTKSASRPAKESGTTKSRGTQPADRKVTDANSGVKSTSARVSIGDLAKRYGKLSRVFTIHGKEYVGVFRQAGNTIEIITTDGTITIPTSAVKKISPYNF